jgi:hypothetical protein
MQAELLKRTQKLREQATVLEAENKAIPVSEIIKDFLYLGGEIDAANISDLTSRGVTHVLNCTVEVKVEYPETITIHRIPVYDYPDQNISQYFQEAFDFIGKHFAGGDFSSE